MLVSIDADSPIWPWLLDSPKVSLCSHLVSGCLICIAAASSCYLKTFSESTNFFNSHTILKGTEKLCCSPISVLGHQRLDQSVLEMGASARLLLPGSQTRAEQKYFVFSDAHTFLEMFQWSVKTRAQISPDPTNISLPCHISSSFFHTSENVI